MDIVVVVIFALAVAIIYMIFYVMIPFIAALYNDDYHE
jgi:hypothetical protein